MRGSSASKTFCALLGSGVTQNERGGGVVLSVRLVVLADVQDFVSPGRHLKHTAAFMVWFGSRLKLPGGGRDCGSGL